MNQIIIWKEVILLEWDGQYPPRTEPQNAPAHWQYLNGIAHWSIKTKKFVLALSTNNLERIFKQFPETRYANATSLQAALSLQDTSKKFKAMCQYAQQIKTTPFDQLPKYDYKVPPLAEYQHRGVVLLTEIPRMPLFADCGCLTGDTKIWVKLNTKQHRRSQPWFHSRMDEFYENYRKYKYTFSVMSYKGAKHERPVRNQDGSYDLKNVETVYDLGTQPVSRSIQSGVKDIWELTLVNGATLKGTKDHEIYTDKGWIELGSLTEEHSVLYNNPKDSYLTAKLVQVKSVKYHGKEMTYDISCAPPHHNFVANGIVAHNCGKTYMVLTSTENHIKTGKIAKGKTLICAKLSTLESGWMEDAAKFTDLKLINLWLPQSKKRKEKTLELLEHECDAYLINHDGVLVFKEALIAKKFHKVIVDESTIIKGYHGDNRNIKTGKFANALLEVSQCAHWRVIMTGTPAPNGPEDLWGQMFFLDPKGNLLEKQFNEFRSLYFDAKKFMLGKKQIVKWEPLPNTFKRISTVIEPLMYRLRIRDHLDLPNLLSMKRYVLMDKEQEKHYNSLKTYLATVINDERINTPIKVTQLMKLRQITGGFIIDHKEEAHSLEKNPKIDELDSILEEEISKEEKVVIYCQYQWEINLIESRYKKYGCVSVYGDNPSKINLENIKRFIEDPSIRIIVLHPRSAAHGVTFVVAHYMIFYSISYSEEEHYQCVKRIERAGQKSNMVVMYLFCKNSVDEVIYEILKTKANDQQKLIDADKMFIENWRTHEKEGIT